MFAMMVGERLCKQLKIVRLFVKVKVRADLLPLLVSTLEVILRSKFVDPPGAFDVDGMR